MLPAALFVYAIIGYAAIGLVFGLAFVSRGVDRVDPGAAGAGLGFRLLILPGSAALWPLLLQRWRRAPDSAPAERNPHRDAARELRS